MRAPGCENSSDPAVPAKAWSAQKATQLGSTQSAQMSSKVLEGAGQKTLVETAPASDDVVEVRPHNGGRFGLILGIVLIFFGIVAALYPHYFVRALPSVSLSDSNVSTLDSSSQLPTTTSAKHPHTPAMISKHVSDDASQEKAPTLEERIASAFHCAGSRTDVFDILSGSATEFGGGKSFEGLSHLVRSAVSSGSSDAELALQRVAVQFASGTGPRALQRRILAAIATPCEDGVVAGQATRPVPLTISREITSTGATSGSWLHRMLLQAGAVTGLRSFQSRARLFSSLSADVVLGAAGIPIGDCFAFRENATLALDVHPDRDSGERAIIRSLVLEQPPRWASPKLGSAPRRFYVDAAPSFEDAPAHDKTVLGEGAERYTMRLGEFEYFLAAPAAQVFELPVSDVPVKGLRLTFVGPGWGEPFTCVYRIRAYDTNSPLRANGTRMASVIA